MLRIVGELNMRNKNIRLMSLKIHLENSLNSMCFLKEQIYPVIGQK